MDRATVRGLGKSFVILFICAACAGVTFGQKARRGRDREADEFGPIVRTYLAYLRDQQEVVDDRVSRREVDRSYYVHNSNRIRALRQMAIRIARETQNDYLPELEAVTQDELDLLFFDDLPNPELLQVGETLNYQLRFLGPVASGREKFYLFARLDPYEQAELRKKGEPQPTRSAPPPAPHSAVSQPTATEPANRPRRVNSP